jgi:DNA-binding LacI/PurR family transcriptional regulator
VDVAARAGVGTATVSRVLNDGHVSASARDKVLTAIGELDYRPSASARALVSGTTGSLGMVIPFFTYPSAVERMRGVLAGVGATGFELVLCNVADPAERDESSAGARRWIERTASSSSRCRRATRKRTGSRARACRSCSSTRTIRGCRAW